MDMNIEGFTKNFQFMKLKDNISQTNFNTYLFQMHEHKSRIRLLKETYLLSCSHIAAIKINILIYVNMVILNIGGARKREILSHNREKYLPFNPMKILIVLPKTFSIHALNHG
jgi:hypothetical protein